MPDTDFTQTEMAAAEHNLDLAVVCQRKAHNALILASEETQRRRDLVSRLQRVAAVQKVVSQ